MKVQLKHDGEPKTASWQFATEADVGLLQDWTNFLNVDSSQEMQDSGDFARQATARWRSYSDERLAAVSQDDAVRRSREIPTQEFAVLLVLKADWWFAPQGVWLAGS